MAIEVKVPELPESVSEATVGEWQKSKGDRVERDENLLDLETDKVVLEVPAVAAGVLAEIKVEAGQTVKAGDVLALLEEGEGGGSSDDDKGGSRDLSGGKKNATRKTAAKSTAKGQTKAKSSK